MYTDKVSILYIITKLELGGAQKVCLSLLNGVKENGGFAALASGTDGPLVKDVQNLDSIFLLKRFKREIGLNNILNEIFLFLDLIRVIKKIKKQHPNLIVHTHSTKAGILGRWAAFFSGIKKRVHTVHGFGFHSNQNKFLWLLIYISEFVTAFITTKFVCVSKHDIKIGSRSLPFFKNRNNIIRAAVEYDNFYVPAKSAKNFDSDKFILGTVSCFKPQKNLIDLLRAFKKLLLDLPEKKNDLLLQIVGDGQLRPQIEQFISENGLTENVELLGWQNNVASWVKTWDLFVMSSLWEGLPCAIVEARLAKLPVVAYNISGIPEVIFDNKNGFLVDVGDWFNLSEKIKFFVQNSAFHFQFSNYQDSLVEFHSDSMVKQHIDFYKSLF